MATAKGTPESANVAVSPLAEHPTRTLLHELAHVVLGHTPSAMNDSGERTPRDIRELEAECTAMLVCASLNLPGVEESRGYIQSWYHDNTVPEHSAQRIFSAADKILKAGQRGGVPMNALAPIADNDGTRIQSRGGSACQGISAGQQSRVYAPRLSL